MNLTKYTQDFPKNYLTVTILNELGDELIDELEIAGCHLVINNDLNDYHFQNITAELQLKVDAKRSNSA